MDIKRLILALCLWPALWSASVSAQALPPVSGVSYDGALISWDETPGAAGYNIFVDDFTYLDTVIGKNEYQPLIDAKYFIGAFDTIGNYSPLQVITNDVVPLTNSVMVSLGATEEIVEGGEVDLIILPVGPVTSVAYNGATITWSDLPNAIGYSVYVDGEYFDTVGAVLEYTPIISGRYTIIGFDGMGNFSPREIIERESLPLTNNVEVVLGASTDDLTDDEALVPIDEPQLDAVTNVSFDGELITWDPVPGAIGYNIYNNSFDYVDTVGALTQYQPLFSEIYYISGYNDDGGYSPLQVITDDVVPLTNFVEVIIE